MGNGSRCTVIIDGLGRCYDETGLPHGHHFKPNSPDKDLSLTQAEARELVAYLMPQYLNPNKWPLVHALMDRLMART